jgi:hypothetical protein
MLCGLVLQRTEDENQSRFRRVGQFFTHENDLLEILGQYKPADRDYERKREWFGTASDMKEIVITKRSPIEPLTSVLKLIMTFRLT